MTAIIGKERSQQERKWRRISLLSLVILVPLTLFEISYDNLKELARGHDLWPNDVTAGQTVPFGGSKWQFVSLKTVNGLKEGSLPAGAVPLVARFLVEVSNPDLQNLWLGCKIKLVDAKGRSWQPASIRGMPIPADGIMGCSSAAFSGAQAGARMVIEENFLVPQEAAGEVRATLGLGSERPYYLRFAVPR